MDTRSETLTLVRDPADPTAVAAQTRSMRVVLGGGQRPAAPVPVPRSGPGDATTELPRVPAAGPADRPADLPPQRRAPQRATGKKPAPAPPVDTGQAGRGAFQLGVVLLPLRLFLGLAFLLEGLRKLYDPGFLDPAATESFAHSITKLRDGSLFPPVMDLAANHAVGAALLFAFGQVLVGFGAVLGLWTRFMAMTGMVLSLGVLIAVGDNGSPYHAAFIVFMAAWSPLALAGSPMYSADAWLSLRDWRGPIVTPVRARRRKLGYGSLIACAGVGVTLIAGAVFGSPEATEDPADEPAGGASAPAVPGGATTTTQAPAEVPGTTAATAESPAAQESVAATPSAGSAKSDPTTGKKTPTGGATKKTQGSSPKTGGSSTNKSGGAPAAAKTTKGNEGGGGGGLVDPGAPIGGLFG